MTLLEKNSQKPEIAKDENEYSPVQVWKERLRSHNYTKIDMAYIGGLAYVLGYLILNVLYFTFWQFTDFFILSQQCMVGTIWLVIPFVLFYLPVPLLNSGIDKFSKYIDKHPVKKYALLFLCFTSAMFFNIPNPGTDWMLTWLRESSQHKSFLAVHGKFIGYAFLFVMFYLIGVLGASTQAGLWRSLDKLPKNKEEKINQRIRLHDIAKVVCGLLILVAFSTPFLLLVYAALPASLGGLSPHAETLWLTHGGLEIIAPNNTGAKKQLDISNELDPSKRPEYYSVPFMYLVHENANYKYIQSNDDTVVIRVPNDLIKGEDWLGIDKSKKQTTTETNLQSQPVQIKQLSETKAQTTSVTKPTPNGSVTIDTTTITTTITATAVPARKTQ